MSKSRMAMMALWALAAKRTGTEPPPYNYIFQDEYGPWPEPQRHNDPSVAAKMRAEREERKRRNYAKRYPNRKTP